MQITTDALEFNSDDIAAWGKFLNSRAGRRLIPKLLESAPTLLGEGDVNKLLIRSGEVRGWSEAVKTLIFLSHEPPLPPAPQTAYEPLDDDAAWENSDGDAKQKLNPS